MGGGGGLGAIAPNQKVFHCIFKKIPNFKNATNSLSLLQNLSLLPGPQCAKPMYLSSDILHTSMGVKATGTNDSV